MAAMRTKQVLWTVAIAASVVIGYDVVKARTGIAPGGN